MLNFVLKSLTHKYKQITEPGSYKCLQYYKQKHVNFWIIITDDLNVSAPDFTDRKNITWQNYQKSINKQDFLRWKRMSVRRYI